MKVPPTVVQTCAETHETATRCLPATGWAVAWIFQIVPFQYSAAAFAVKLSWGRLAAPGTGDSRGHRGPALGGGRLTGTNPTGPISHWQSIDDPNGVGSTVVNGINAAGDLVGFYTDAAGNTDGMLATP